MVEGMKVWSCANYGSERFEAIEGVESARNKLRK